MVPMEVPSQKNSMDVHVPDPLAVTTNEAVYQVFATTVWRGEEVRVVRTPLAAVRIWTWLLPTVIPKA